MSSETTRQDAWQYAREQAALILDTDRTTAELTEAAWNLASAFRDIDTGTVTGAGTGRTPEDIISRVLVANPPLNDLQSKGVWQTMDTDTRSSWLADRLIRALTENGFEIEDTLQPVRGGDITEGAGPDATCGCGEPITQYDGEWLHIYNPELRGTDDHDAHPDDLR